VVERKSPALELHGAPTGNCLRVSVALEVLGIDYTVRPVDLRSGKHIEPEFLELNPFGRVPVLVDRSAADAPFVLTQSNAILLYVCPLKPGILLPAEDDPLRARVLERFFYFVTEVIAPSYGSFFLRRHGAQPGSEMLGHLMAEAIVGAERFLAEASHMAGELFSLADVAALTVISASRDRVDWNRAPRLAEWLHRVLGREDVQRGLAAFSNTNTR
jgi:GST-like protein